MARSKEVVHKVEATLVSTDEAFLPKTAEEFKGELPATRNECLRSLVANVAYAQKQNALRMWFVGKIVVTLQERGEENVFEEVTSLTGFKQRALYQRIAVYREFADPEYMADIGKVLNWTNVRNLLNIKNPEKRKKICDRVLEGELTDGNVDTAIKTTVAEERKEKEKEKEEDPDTKDPVGPKPKKPNPSVVFTKIENNCLNFKKAAQEMEAEYVEMCKYVWNPEFVDKQDFVKHTDIAERALTALKALGKEINSMIPVFTTNLEDGPNKKD